MTRRRWLALVPVVLALTGGSAYLFAPRAAATDPPAERGPAALLVVASRSQSPLPGPAPTPAEAEAYRRTQAAMLRIEFVLNAALRVPAARDALKGQADPIAWLVSHLTAEYKDGSEVMRVGVTGLPPREAAAVVNAVTAAYLAELAVQNRAAALRHAKRLEDARADVQQKLGRQRAAVADLARAAGLPADGADRRAAVAAMYHERAELRVAAAVSEEAVKGKRIAAAMADVDGRIRRAEDEGPRLDAAQAELRPLEAADATLAAELVRLEFEANAPPRVALLQPATAEPGKE